MRSNIIICLGFACLFSVLKSELKAQPDEHKSRFKIAADLVSYYVWRGSMATGSPDPNFQPTLTVSSGNLELGFWSSTNFSGSYKELDPNISLNLGQMKIGFTDYNWNFDKANYFNYKNNVTGHRLEGALAFTGKDIPVSISWNTIFYGFDKVPDDSAKQAFSTYVEIAYTSGPVTCFLGLTPWSGLYNNYGFTSFDATANKKTFSVVNIGASVTKELTISENFSIPFKCTLIVNPSASYTRSDYIHLVFGITF